MVIGDAHVQPGKTICAKLALQHWSNDATCLIKNQYGYISDF